MHYVENFEELLQFNVSERDGLEWNWKYTIFFETPRSVRGNPDCSVSNVKRPIIISAKRFPNTNNIKQFKADSISVPETWGRGVEREEDKEGKGKRRKKKNTDKVEKKILHNCILPLGILLSKYTT